jgi:hypothetical protein
MSSSEYSARCRPIRPQKLLVTRDCASVGGHVTQTQLIWGAAVPDVSLSPLSLSLEGSSQSRARPVPPLTMVPPSDLPMMSCLTSYGRQVRPSPRQPPDLNQGRNSSIPALGCALIPMVYSVASQASFLIVTLRNLSMITWPEVTVVLVSFQPALFSPSSPAHQPY